MGRCGVCGGCGWWPVSAASEGGWGRVARVVVLGQQESTIFWRRGRHVGGRWVWWAVLRWRL